LPGSTFSISGSPVTGTGTLAGNYVNQNASYVLAGPNSGSSAATPAWRQLSQDDILPGFTITSFNCGACTAVELGDTVANPSFTATYSSTPASAAITNTDGISSPTNLTTPFTSGTVTGSFVHTAVTTTTFTLTAISTSTKTSTKSISWQPRTFYGVGSLGATGATASGNNAVLVGATGTLGTWGLGTNTGTVSVTPSGQDIYFLLSTTGHNFKVNGFTTSFSCSAVSFTNQNGVVVNPMYLCAGPTILTGTYSVEVD
jgi:hypothetical protein